MCVLLKKLFNPLRQKHLMAKKQVTVKKQAVKKQAAAKFVVKKTTGSSGDGVRILKSADELPQLVLDGFLDNETEIILEEYVDSIKNYGIQ